MREPSNDCYGKANDCSCSYETVDGLLGGGSYHVVGCGQRRLLSLVGCTRVTMWLTFQVPLPTLFGVPIPSTDWTTTDEAMKGRVLPPKAKDKGKEEKERPRWCERFCFCCVLVACRWFSSSS